MPLLIHERWKNLIPSVISMRSKKEDEVLGSSYTLSKAVHTLLDSPKFLQHELIATFNECCDV